MPCWRWRTLHPKFKTGMDNENKSEKCGAFFACDFDVVFAPRLPRIPPRFHHQKTTILHYFFAKPPAKTHLHHNRKKRRSKRQICIQPPMESRTPPPEKRPAFSSPLLFFVIVGIVIACITLFLVFRPNPSGTTPQSNAPAT